jgi:uncharacterized protein
MSALVGLAVLVASFAQQPAAPDATARGQAVLAAMLAGNFTAVESQFTDEMKRALPPGRLGAVWGGLLAQAGAHKSCTTPRLRAIADKQMVITPCVFERAQFDIQFAFDGTGRISGLVFRPAASGAAPYVTPSYVDPAAYAEGEATVGTGEWALPATLTLPAGAARLPAVVLVHGSGPNDRDETVGANKPFKDLAGGLASRGIAVLRYDKRTKVHAGKLSAVANFTVSQEVIEDAVAAVRSLRAHPRIDPARIFVLGHSLGGMLAPRMAAAEPSIAGLVVLAGPARPLEEAVAAQGRYLAAADGAISAEEQRGIEQVDAFAESIRTLKPEDAAAGRMIGPAPASYWLDLRGYDPPAAAKQIETPMLILQGERDYQVTVEEFAKWKTALAGRPNVTVRSYPTLNHLFMSGTGPSLPAEYQVPGHVAEEVIRDITAWILGR